MAPVDGSSWKANSLSNITSVGIEMHKGDFYFKEVEPVEPINEPMQALL